MTGGIRAYATHRKHLGLPGGSHQAVQRAVERERLHRSVHRVAGAVVIDFDLADREWDANTDTSRRPVSEELRAQTAARGDSEFDSRGSDIAIDPETLSVLFDGHDVVLSHGNFDDEASVIVLPMAPATAAMLARALMAKARSSVRGTGA